MPSASACERSRPRLLVSISPRVKRIMFGAGEHTQLQEVEMPIDQLRKFVAALMVLDLLAVYAYCLGINGVYPPSHPWSGIVLIVLSVGLVRLPRQAEPHMWMLSALTVLGAGFWTLAAIQHP